MKKNILTALSVCLAIAASAQVKPLVNEGGLIIKGGVNFANITVTENGRVDDANSLTSYHVGAVADIPLSDGLSLQPGLIFTGKGSKTMVGRTTDNSYYRATSNPFYLELPLNLVGKIPLGPGNNLFIGVGPYGAMGISGKNTVEGRSFGAAIYSERDIVYSDDNPFTRPEENAGYGKLKRFDYGLNALGGLEISRFIISANYGYGLTKINSNTNNNANDQGKHRVVSLSIGFKL